jgi:hypothetical protein
MAAFAPVYNVTAEAAVILSSHGLLVIAPLLATMENRTSVNLSCLRHLKHGRLLAHPEEAEAYAADLKAVDGALPGADLMPNGATTYANQLIDVCEAADLTHKVATAALLTGGGGGGGGAAAGGGGLGAPTGGGTLVHDLAMEIGNLTRAQALEATREVPQTYERERMAAVTRVLHWQPLESEVGNRGALHKARVSLDQGEWPSNQQMPYLSIKSGLGGAPLADLVQGVRSDGSVGLISADTGAADGNGYHHVAQYKLKLMTCMVVTLGETAKVGYESAGAGDVGGPVPTSMGFAEVVRVGSALDAGPRGGVGKAAMALLIVAFDDSVRAYTRAPYLNTPGRALMLATPNLMQSIQTQAAVAAQLKVTGDGNPKPAKKGKGNGNGDQPLKLSKADIQRITNGLRPKGGGGGAAAAAAAAVTTATTGGGGGGGGGNPAPGVEACGDFKKGKCNRGTNCRYSH